jgi:hypothetical protein
LESTSAATVISKRMTPPPASILKNRANGLVNRSTNSFGSRVISVSVCCCLLFRVTLRIRPRYGVATTGLTNPITSTFQQRTMAHVIIDIVTAYRVGLYDAEPGSCNKRLCSLSRGNTTVGHQSKCFSSEVAVVCVVNFLVYSSCLRRLQTGVREMHGAMQASHLYQVNSGKDVA